MPGNYHLASAPGAVTFHEMNRFLLVALFATALAPAQAADPAIPAPAAAATKNLLPDDGDAAWKDIVAATTPPVPPAEWNQKEPTKDEYDAFYDALLAAQSVEEKDWEKLRYFESCLPIEEIARRGRGERFLRSAGSFRSS